MSGHNKWSTIKHKKAAVDAKRGKIFSRVSKEITIAAKTGGGDPEMNPRLRAAISAGKSVNMPNDNIDRAIKKGTGELPGVSYEEIVYECYGPSGVGIILEVLTDNRNRAASEVRSTLDKRGGSLASSGAVAWQFNRKGYITVKTDATDEDSVFMIVTEAGAEDMEINDELYCITTPYEELETVRKALETEGIETESCALTMIPSSTVNISNEKEGAALMRLLDVLDELDDIQNVYTNFEMADEMMEKIAAE